MTTKKHSKPISEKIKVISDQIVAYGTFILAVATVVLATQTWILADKTSFLVEESKQQRRESSYRSNAEFVYKFYKDYFTPEFRDLIALLDSKQLIFISDPSNEDTLVNIVKQYPEIFPNGFPKGFSKEFPSEYPIFWISNQYSEMIHALTFKKKYYTSYEMDDIVMNPMDNLGNYFKTGIVTDTSYISTAFGWYLAVIWENKPIKQYAVWLRENMIDETAHMHGLESLYWMLRDKYAIKEQFSDDTICSNKIKCCGGKFIWCKPRNPMLQHE